MLQRIFRHARDLWRVEGTIAHARFGLTMRRSVLYALAGLIAIFGLAMLNVAAFFGFQAAWGPVWAAVAAACGDFVVAAIVAAIALTTKPGPHLERRARNAAVGARRHRRRDRDAAAPSRLAVARRAQLHRCGAAGAPHTPCHRHRPRPAPEKGRTEIGSMAITRAAAG